MNVDHIFVSVVMPVYNAAPYLPESISSILAQTHTNFEFIIVDDGSEDQSVAVIQAYKDSRIRLIQKRENTGIGASLNEGLAVASGQYIIRMDADDQSMPHRIATQVKFMEENPKIGVSGSFIQKFQVVDNEQKLLAKYTYPTDSQLCRLHLFTHQPLTYHPTVIIRHSLLKKHKLNYDPSKDPSEDSNLWHRLSPYCEFSNIPEVLLFYRVHAQQASTIFNHLLISNYLSSFKQLLQTIHPEITSQEFEIHCDFFTQKHSDFSLQKLKATITWLHKLLKINQTLNNYICDHEMLRADIEEKWFKLCNHHTRFGFKTWLIYKRSNLYKLHKTGKKNKILFFVDCLFALRSKYLGKQ